MELRAQSVTEHLRCQTVLRKLNCLAQKQKHPRQSLKWGMINPPTRRLRYTGNTCNLGVTWYDHTLLRNNKRNKVHQGICGSCNSSPIHALPALQSTALESPQLATVTVRVEPAVQSQKKKSKSVTAKAKVFVSPTKSY